MAERPVLVLLEGGLSRAWPTDARGQPLPREPLRGLRINIEYGGSISNFDRWSLVGLNAETFTVRTGRREQTRPRAEWEAWLWERRAEGRVTVHYQGCHPEACPGCPPRIQIPKRPKLVCPTQP